MKKILILGSAGSGKSTLAKRLGEITGIDVLHLDTIHWKPGWIEAPREEFLSKLKAFLEKDSWIIDGNYRSTLDMRLELADTVIFIDMSRLFCIYRAIKRRFMYKGKSRPDITQGCDEKIDWEFLKWIWQYPIKNKPEILAKLENCLTEKEIYILKGKKEIERFIENVKNIHVID
ncbi:DNA topology modulation protein [Caloranaerobacter ferrireducens]|uniref:DNA topology modulation protein n=1 Tax=Caloranaerobacter ferrireducens TaxID=1323370 RepID=UPI00084D9EA4|nr:DNA topology modulation protein [Caloranaerobacter ferrireducens]